MGRQDLLAILYSDNAKNKSASLCIKGLIRAVRLQEGTHEVDWKFVIEFPPRQGSAWESDYNVKLFSESVEQ